MSTYMSEGVGKRIVDALKKQSEADLVNQITTPVSENIAVEQPSIEPEQFYAESSTFENTFVNPQSTMQQPVFGASMNPQPAINSNIAKQNNIYNSPINNNFSDLGGLEVPANVAVLRQLISQLPSGVSRQAGALVIKQTMEALGISMKSVLQEAQQLQENINASARDCQNSILECKKQINTLEAQVQKYQKQSASLNDIVSLFLQIN